jgi:hypothetical protein
MTKMISSFYHLFASYSKHVQRYFSSVAEVSYEYSDMTESFHEVLILALRDFSDCLRDSHATAAGYSCQQIEGLIPVLSAAFEEATKEAELNSEIHSCFCPSYFMLLNPDRIADKMFQLESFIGVCRPISEADNA